MNIKRFLKVSSLEEDHTNDTGSNGDGRGRGYGHGMHFGMGSLYGECLCSPFADIDSIQGITEFNGQPVYVVNNTSVIFLSIHLDIARVNVIQNDLSLKERYICKIGNCFAFGDTVEDAHSNAMEDAVKYECSECKETFLGDTMEKYPNVDALIPNMELFNLHNIITGSCLEGREAFFKEHGYTEDGFTTMREFLTVTKNYYGGFRIQELAAGYNIKI